MVVVDTEISWGYEPLLRIFAQANSLVLEFERYYHELDREEELSLGKKSKITICREYTRIMYEENSDTAFSITFMSIRHCGFENMLCDYLIRCNIDPKMIPIGRVQEKRDPVELEKSWLEHRKKIGLIR